MRRLLTWSQSGLRTSAPGLFTWHTRISSRLMTSQRWLALAPAAALDITGCSFCAWGWVGWQNAAIEKPAVTAKTTGLSIGAYLLPAARKRRALKKRKAAFAA